MGDMSERLKKIAVGNVVEAEESQNSKAVTTDQRGRGSQEED